MLRESLTMAPLAQYWTSRKGNPRWWYAKQKWTKGVQNTFFGIYVFYCKSLYKFLSRESQMFAHPRSILDDV